MKMPLVSIIVPCYNQKQYLSQCLQSVFDQTYVNWECIIVNDGSPDNTEEEALKWTLKDNRFKYIKKDNGGLSSARNAGITMAVGEWILPLDADDYISNDYLELAKKYFYSENVKIIYCNSEKFGSEKGFWKLPEFSLERIAINNVIFCTAFFKKTEWEKVSGYDENLKEGCEDWEFWISLLKNGGDVVKINNICFYYRVKEESMVKSITREKFVRIYTYIEKKHIDFFIKYLGVFHYVYKEKEDYKEKYNKILNSRRYKIGNYIAKIFNR